MRESNSKENSNNVNFSKNSIKNIQIKLDEMIEEKNTLQQEQLDNYFDMRKSIKILKNIVNRYEKRNPYIKTSNKEMVNKIKSQREWVKLLKNKSKSINMQLEMLTNNIEDLKDTIKRQESKSNSQNSIRQNTATAHVTRKSSLKKTSRYSSSTSPSSSLDKKHKKISWSNEVEDKVKKTNDSPVEEQERKNRAERTDLLKDYMKTLEETITPLTEYNQSNDSYKKIIEKIDNYEKKYKKLFFGKLILALMKIFSPTLKQMYKDKNNLVSVSHEQANNIKDKLDNLHNHDHNIIRENVCPIAKDIHRHLSLHSNFKGHFDEESVIPRFNVEDKSSQDAQDEKANKYLNSKLDALIRCESKEEAITLDQDSKNMVTHGNLASMVKILSHRVNSFKDQEIPNDNETSGYSR